MQELVVNQQTESKWEAAPAPMAGAEIKFLRQEGLKKTYLLKLPAHFRGSAHVHSQTEQHFVLEGSYINGDNYEAGDYRLIPAGNAHDPMESEKGALVLVIQEP